VRQKFEAAESMTEKMNLLQKTITKIRSYPEKRIRNVRKLSCKIVPADAERISAYCLQKRKKCEIMTCHLQKVKSVKTVCIAEKKNNFTLISSHYDKIELGYFEHHPKFLAQRNYIGLCES